MPENNPNETIRRNKGGPKELPRFKEKELAEIFKQYPQLKDGNVVIVDGLKYHLHGKKLIIDENADKSADIQGKPHNHTIDLSQETEIHKMVVEFNTIFKELKDIKYKKYIDPNRSEVQLNTIDYSNLTSNPEKRLFYRKKNKGGEIKHGTLKFNLKDNNFMYEYSKINNEEAKKMLSEFKALIKQCKEYWAEKEKKSSNINNRLINICNKIPNPDNILKYKINGEEMKIWSNHDDHQSFDNIIFTIGGKRYIIRHYFLTGGITFEDENGTYELEENQLNKFLDQIEQIITNSEPTKSNIDNIKQFIGSQKNVIYQYAKVVK